MCNRIKWKLTTRSWCRPWPPPSDVSSWSVLVSWSGRRIPRVAVVAAPATCAQSLSLVRRQGIGNLAQKVSVHCPEARSHKTENVGCLHEIYFFWVKIILQLHPPTFMLYWAKHIMPYGDISKENTEYSHEILKLLRLEAASWGQWRGYLSGGQNVLGAEKRQLWRVGGEILIVIDPYHPRWAGAGHEIVYCRW